MASFISLISTNSDKSLNSNTITVTLAYSPAPRKVVEKELILPFNCTVQEALKYVNQANLAEFTHDDDDHLGIWGKKTTLSHVLQNLDRLELYRPLKVDPKVARRERFQKQGARTTGLFAKTRVDGKAGY
jgi:putative ubiquitin-RnfH superfamily antitoxin RatB of RatAB toxin-antitoxin module